MKAILPLLALMLCVTVKADPLAEVKRVMDEPVVMKYEGRRVAGASIATEDRIAIATATKRTVQEIEQNRGVKLSPREFLAVAGSAQGQSSKQLSVLAHLAASNAAVLRTTLMPALKAANLTAATSDLEEALKLVEASKRLDRAAQDRFARLARIAP